MIPIKDKKYMLNCQGPYDYNRYMGEGVFTGEVTGFENDETCYGFIIPTEKEICFFVKEEIVAEFSNGLVKEPEQIQDQIDSESLYCETCDSCGETGCCPPVKCQAVKCKYGEINIKDYRCFQDQWSVMYEALKYIVEECGEEHIGNIANDALKAVDEEWDKLYSKE